MHVHLLEEIASQSKRSFTPACNFGMEDTSLSEGEGEGESEDDEEDGKFKILQYQISNPPKSYPLRHLLYVCPLPREIEVLVSQMHDRSSLNLRIGQRSARISLRFPS